MAERVIKSLINNRLILLTVGWHESFVFFSSFYTSFNAVDLVKLIGVPLLILTNLRLQDENCVVKTRTVN